MSRLNAEQRKARDNERFSQRVDERRVKGEDVVAYALANKKAYKFLTKTEKHELKVRQADLLEQSKVSMQTKSQLELIKAAAKFPQD